MGRKRPAKHTVHTKHPRYKVPIYPRGQGGNNNMNTQPSSNHIQNNQTSKSIEDLISFEYTDPNNNEAGRVICNQCGKQYKWVDWRNGMPLSSVNMAKHLIKEHGLSMYENKNEPKLIVAIFNRHAVKKRIRDYIEYIDNIT